MSAFVTIRNDDDGFVLHVLKSHIKCVISPTDEPKGGYHLYGVMTLDGGSIIGKVNERHEAESAYAKILQEMEDYCGDYPQALDLRIPGLSRTAERVAEEKAKMEYEQKLQKLINEMAPEWSKGNKSD